MCRRDDGDDKATLAAERRGQWQQRAAVGRVVGVNPGIPDRVHSAEIGGVGKPDLN